MSLHAFQPHLSRSWKVITYYKHILWHPGAMFDPKIHSIHVIITSLDKNSRVKITSSTVECSWHALHWAIMISGQHVGSDAFAATATARTAMVVVILIIVLVYFWWMKLCVTSHWGSAMAGTVNGRLKTVFLHHCNETCWYLSLSLIIGQNYPW